MSVQFFRDLQVTPLSVAPGLVQGLDSGLYYSSVLKAFSVLFWVCFVYAQLKGGPGLVPIHVQNQEILFFSSHPLPIFLSHTHCPSQSAFPFLWTKMRFLQEFQLPALPNVTIQNQMEKRRGKKQETALSGCFFDSSPQSTCFCLLFRDLSCFFVFCLEFLILFFKFFFFRVFNSNQ